MAIPIYLWRYDEEEQLVMGSADIKGREGSIEVVGMQHEIFIPADHITGIITATQQHEAYAFEKEIDRASPSLYHAVTTGRILTKAIFRYYRINCNGSEEE